jgi:hypothetical protein
MWGGCAAQAFAAAPEKGGQERLPDGADLATEVIAANPPMGRWQIGARGPVGCGSTKRGSGGLGRIQRISMLHASLPVSGFKLKKAFYCLGGPASPPSLPLLL